MKNIFIDSAPSRFANQLYPIAFALTLYDKYPGCFNKPLYKIHIQPKYCINILKKYFSEYINFDLNTFEEQYKLSKKEGIKDNVLTNESHIRCLYYCQDNNLIDEKIIQKYLCVPNEIKEQIYDLYGDISDYICLHVRRGDYLKEKHSELYQVLTKEYIERVISKYFPNDKIICISDDIKWCKENLSNNANIIFADKSSDPIIDFYIQTLTKGNIISGSTFSTMGVLLNPNPNKICIAPEPMFKHKPWNKDLNICPDYAIREQLNIQ